MKNAQSSSYATLLKLVHKLGILPKHVNDPFISYSQYSFQRHLLFGAFGTLGFPLYSYIWTYIFPQPYENPALRFILCISCLGFALLDYWPKKWRRFEHIYWLALTLFALPFFFTFMLLMNGFNPAWSMSLIAQIVILVLLLDGKNFLFHQITGSILAYFAYIATTGTLHVKLSMNHILTGELISVVLFTLIGVLIFNVSRLVTATRNESAINVGHRIAHELRTPLQAVINYAERINARDTPAASQKSHADLAMIQKEAQHCLVSLELLLASANSSPPEIGGPPVSLSKIISTSITATTRHKGQEQWFTIEHIGDIHLQTTSNVLRHLLDNLITNAIYAVQQADRCAEGVINISINGPKYTLRISDNGCGIPPTHLPQVFEPFFTTKKTGTGLGLPYCREIIEALGGRIEILPRHQKGTCVFIQFPATSSHITGIDPTDSISTTR